MNDAPTELQSQEDAWAQTLARIAADRAKASEQEATGRGVRRRVAPTSLKVGDADDGDSPAKRKKGKGKAKPLAAFDGEDAFVASEIESVGSIMGSVPSDPIETDLASLSETQKHTKRSAYFDPTARTPSPEPIVLYPAIPSTAAAGADEDNRVCGLCGLAHGNGWCFMTESSENLAEYRGILTSHAGDESLAERVSRSHLD